MKKKITTGFVIQTYDDNGNCVAQEFVAGDEVAWETANGKSIEEPPDHKYQPFHMQSPIPLCYDCAKITRRCSECKDKVNNERSSD